MGKPPMPSHACHPRLPQVRGTTVSTHLFFMTSSVPVFPVARWTGRGGGGSTQSWSSHAILWDIPWLPSTDMDQEVGGGLLLLQKLWLPGFLCNVYTRNQFGRLIHTEQGSQKAPWKSSRVTPSSKRHRHRLAGRLCHCKTRPGKLRMFLPFGSLLTRGASHFTLLDGV